MIIGQKEAVREVCELMMETNKLVSIARSILSKEQFLEVVKIIEKDLGIVIDLDLKGEPGPKGPG